MSMVKSELENARKLLYVKIRNENKGYFWFFIIVAIFFVVITAPLVVGLFRGGTPGVNFLNMTDFSTTFFFGMMLGLIILLFIYRKNNDYLSVFPQTNTTRFIASEASNYLSMLLLGVASLVFYLLQNGIVLLLSAFRENIYFVLTFNMGFVAVGFITYLMYGFLMVAVFGLIGAILRKWTYYAAMAFITLTVLGFTYHEMLIANAPALFGVITREPSFGLFMLKAVVLWIVIFAVSFVINRHTVYHKSQDMTITKRVVIVCIGTVVIIASVSAAVFTHTTDTTIAANMDVHDVDEFARRFFANSEEIRIDISLLPRGSDIYLTTENFSDARAGGWLTVTGRGWAAVVGGLDSLYDIQGDNLIIQFRPPFFEINGIEIAHFANPRLIATLDGNNLHLVYEYENAHAVAIPVWGIARQFEAFRGRGIVRDYWLVTSSGGNMFANVHISVE